jgi:hypothetical protein
MKMRRCSQTCRWRKLCKPRRCKRRRICRQHMLYRLHPAGSSQVYKLGLGTQLVKPWGLQWGTQLVRGSGSWNIAACQCILPSICQQDSRGILQSCESPGT